MTGGNGHWVIPPRPITLDHNNGWACVADFVGSCPPKKCPPGPERLYAQSWPRYNPQAHARHPKDNISRATKSQGKRAVSGWPPTGRSMTIDRPGQDGCPVLLRRLSQRKCAGGNLLINLFEGPAHLLEGLADPIFVFHQG